MRKWRLPWNYPRAAIFGDWSLSSRHSASVSTAEAQTQCTRSDASGSVSQDLSVGLRSPLPLALTTDEEESVVSVWERQRGQQDNFSFFLRPLLTRFLNHDAFVRDIRLTAGQSREIQTQRKGLWWMWWMAAAVLTVSTFWSSYVWLFHNQNAASLSYATRTLSFI